MVQESLIKKIADKFSVYSRWSRRYIDTQKLEENLGKYAERVYISTLLAGLPLALTFSLYSMDNNKSAHQIIERYRGHMENSSQPTNNLEKISK